nr:hypothetical protein [Ammoniphilus oxalaticus]
MTLVLIAGLIIPNNGKAYVSMPCCSIMEPVNTAYENAKGAALVYKVNLLAPSFPRTHISIHATHLPAPSSLGDYDGFEGFAFIQNEISWRFKLYPTPEEDGPTWAGRIDIITADLTNSVIQVRLSNSKTGKLGPIVLSSNIESCK